MLKKIFVHIGLFKTGSTSIQYFLNSNMFHLYEKDYFYPSTGRHPRAHVQHTLVSDAFKKTQSSAGDFVLSDEINPSLIIDMLLHEISIAGRNNTIISSESFCTLSRDSVEFFGEKFKNFDIVPIIYVRNMVDLADASYQTHIMTNSTKKSFVEMGFESWPYAFDIVAMCKSWSSISKDNKIIIRDFDNLTDGNVIVDFCQSIGLGLSGLDQTLLNGRLNVSIPMIGVLLKHKLVNAGENLIEVEKFIREIKPDKESKHQSAVPYLLQKQMHDSYQKQMRSIRDSDYGINLNFKEDQEFREKVFIGDAVENINSIVKAYEFLKK
jgi:hypothetical protein